MSIRDTDFIDVVIKDFKIENPNQTVQNMRVFFDSKIVLIRNLFWQKNKNYTVLLCQDITVVFYALQLLNLFARPKEV